MAGWIVGIVGVMFLVGAVLERIMARVEEQYWGRYDRGEATLRQLMGFLALHSLMSFLVPAGFAVLYFWWFENSLILGLAAACMGCGLGFVASYYAALISRRVRAGGATGGSRGD